MKLLLNIFRRILGIVLISSGAYLLITYNDTTNSLSDVPAVLIMLAGCYALISDLIQFKNPTLQGMRQNIVFFIVVVFFFTIIGTLSWALSFQKSYELENNSSVAEAEVILIESHPKGGENKKFITYTFYTDRVIESQTSIEDEEFSEGDTLIIRYSLSDPTINEIEGKKESSN